VAVTIENAGGWSQVVVTYALTTPDPPRRELDGFANG
jgi:hypothetical protein